MPLHAPNRPKVVAAVLGVVTAFSTVTLAGAGWTTLPTRSQGTLALVGSVLAGSLAVRAGWPTPCAKKKKSYWPIWLVPLVFVLIDLAHPSAA